MRIEVVGSINTNVKDNTKYTTVISNSIDLIFENNNDNSNNNDKKEEVKEEEYQKMICHSKIKRRNVNE